MGNEILLLTCGVVFIIVGFESSLISSISPQMIDILEMPRGYVDALYSIPFLIAFVSTIVLCQYLLKKRNLDYYLKVGCIFFGCSTGLINTMFLLPSSFFYALCIFGVITMILFGLSIAPIYTSLETMLNNRFSTSNNVYMNRGIWSIIFIFTQIGIIASYIFPPIVIAHSRLDFVIMMDIILAILIGCIWYIIKYYPEDLKMNVREMNIFPPPAKNIPFYSIISFNMLTTGCYLTILQFFPQDAIVFNMMDSQSLIALCVLSGSLLSFFVWYIGIFSVFTWVIVTGLSMIVSFAGLILFSFTPTENEFLPFAIACICIGYIMLYPSMRIATINIFKGDEVRITFVWLIMSTYLIISVFSQIVNLLQFVIYGLEMGFSVCLFALVLSLFPFILVIQELWGISNEEFKSNGSVLIDINVEKMNYATVDQDEHTA